LEERTEGNMCNNDLGRLISSAALAVVPMLIATVVAAQGIAAQSATQAGPSPAPQIPPALVPSHVVDLMAAEGTATFGAQWKTMEAKIVEAPGAPKRHARLQDVL
jgi:hypothetical protein